LRQPNYIEVRMIWSTQIEFGNESFLLNSSAIPGDEMESPTRVQYTSKSWSLRRVKGDQKNWNRIKKFWQSGRAGRIFEGRKRKWIQMGYLKRGYFWNQNQQTEWEEDGKKEMWASHGGGGPPAPGRRSHLVRMKWKVSRDFLPRFYAVEIYNSRILDSNTNCFFGGGGDLLPLLRITLWPQFNFLVSDILTLKPLFQFQFQPIRVFPSSPDLEIRQSPTLGRSLVIDPPGPAERQAGEITFYYNFHFERPIFMGSSILLWDLPLEY